MSLKVRSIFLCFLCTALSMAVSYVPVMSYAADDPFEIQIQVAPSTLNIQNQGQVVTVHTSIAFSSVDTESVYLNGILIDSWKADNQGNFVAKFLMSEVKDLYLDTPGEYELTLTGSTTGGTEFWGTTYITVINILPSGSGGK